MFLTISTLKMTFQNLQIKIRLSAVAYSRPETRGVSTGNCPLPEFSKTFESTNNFLVVR